jgi:hypothetical protein
MYESFIEANKGKEFRPARTFNSDNSHIAVLTQSLAQDILWVDQAARKIYSDYRMRVYFIEIGNVEPIQQYYVLVPLEANFRALFKAAWRRLAQDGTLELHVFGEETEEAPVAKWMGRIVDNPASIAALVDHLVEDHELILHVRRPAAKQIDNGPNFKPRTFQTRRDAQVALKQSQDQ